MKIVIDGHRDLIIVSVDMPFLNGTMEQKIEYFFYIYLSLKTQLMQYSRKNRMN